MAYVLHRDEYGFADSIDDKDGMVVLHLRPGTERNEQNAETFVAALAAKDQEIEEGAKMVREQGREVERLRVKMDALRARLAAAEEDRAASQELGEQAIDELSAMRVKLAAVEEQERASTIELGKWVLEFGTFEQARAKLAAVKEDQDG